MSESAVLDASALMAFILDEPGARVLDDAVARNAELLVSAVNVAEVGSKLSDYEHSEEEVRDLLTNLPVVFVPFSVEQAFLAASLRPHTRSQGLSAGDRACLALAQSESLPVYTADRPWSRLSLGVEIRMIR